MQNMRLSLQARYLIPLLLVAVLLSLWFLFRQPAGQQPVIAEDDASELQLPQLDFESFELANGLDVILHRDNSRPLVAVGVWYRVGSSYEWRGGTGLAHLLEHLMFNGSAGYPENYFKALEAAGVTDINGTTNRDRTNYFQTVPKDALDLVLWLESDRMGWMLADPERLQRQIGVIKNEKLLRENYPYGTAWNYLLQLLYGNDHPYSWPTIGFVPDLEAMDSADVRRFHSSWYAPNNAVLVLAGDLDIASARAKIETYFGPIPEGALPAEPQAPPPVLLSNRRLEISDRVPYPRIYRSWIAPPATDVMQTSPLYLACQLLGGNKRSLLYRRLVLQQQLANFASCHSSFSRLSGEITLVIEARGDKEIQRIEEQLDILLADFRRSMPDPEEMARLIRAEVGSMLRSADKLGGWGGRISQLAEGAILTGNPRLWEVEFNELQQLQPPHVQQAVERWLSGHWAQLTLLPADRPALPPAPFVSEAHLPVPEPAEPLQPLSNRPDLPTVLPPTLPEIPIAEQWRLTDDCPAEDSDCTAADPAGLDLYLIQRNGAHLVSLDLQFPCRRNDELEPAGLGNFAVHMMAQGTQSYDLQGISSLANDLAGAFRLYARPDYCGLAASVPAPNLVNALPLIDELAFKPRFAEADLIREQGRWLSSIAGEYSGARTLALRLLPPLLYGDGHPYGVPATGTGYRVPISALITDDLRNWQRRVFRRDRGALVVAGDFADGRGKALRSALEEQFGGRVRRVPIYRSTAASAGCAPPKQPGKRHKTNLQSTEPTAQRRRLIFVPAPGRSQSVIVTGQLLLQADLQRDLTEPLGACSRIALELANEAFGGNVTARLGRVLREDKGWSYGSHSLITDPQGTPAMLTFTSVQADKTAPALAEILRLGSEFTGDRPLQKAEWQRTRNALLRQLPGSLESLGSLRRLYSQAIGKNRSGGAKSPSWWSRTRMQLIRDLRLSEIRQQIRRIQPENWTLIIVGDPQVLDSLRQLNPGEIEVRQMDIPED